MKHISMILASCVLALPACAQIRAVTPLSSLNLAFGESGWGNPKPNLAISGQALSIGGQKFPNGYGTHAPASILVETNGAKKFSALVGVDDGAPENVGSVEFFIESDGKILWQSGVMKRGDAAKTVDVDVSKVKWVKLRVSDAGNGAASDHADWANARFEGGAPKAMAHLPSQNNMILSGKPWLDTKGELIQAHGGGILERNGTYYWYGENKSEGYNNRVGVSGYKSKDLIKWEPMGVVMKSADYPEKYREKGVCERPKVIYNAKTGKYVMWAHMDVNGYASSDAGVCVADKPQGPFKFVRAFRPREGQTYRDMNLFVDDDGSAYTFYSSEENATMHIVKLSDDYLDVAPNLEEGKNWTRAFVGRMREAPAPFKVGKKYYIITSACTGWAPNAAGYATADNILGPWTQHGNPFVGEGSDTTFRSQSTYVLPLKGAKNRFLYMGDRWNPQDLANSRYIWLPFSVKDDGTFEVMWNGAWKS